jgi:hypothetical protein
LYFAPVPLSALTLLAPPLNSLLIFINPLHAARLEIPKMWKSSSRGGFIPRYVLSLLGVWR